MSGVVEYTMRDIWLLVALVLVDGVLSRRTEALKALRELQAVCAR